MSLKYLRQNNSSNLAYLFFADSSSGEVFVFANNVTTDATWTQQQVLTTSAAGGGLGVSITNAGTDLLFAGANQAGEHPKHFFSISRQPFPLSSIASAFGCKI